MADSDSTRATGFGEAMFSAVGHGIALKSLVVPRIRAGFIAAGQVAKQHDILIQKRHMFVVLRGPPTATKLIHARGTIVREVYQLDVAHHHTVRAVDRIPEIPSASRHVQSRTCRRFTAHRPRASHHLCHTPQDSLH
jgi:hypothetical protein